MNLNLSAKQGVSIPLSQLFLINVRLESNRKLHIWFVAFVISAESVCFASSTYVYILHTHTHTHTIIMLLMSPLW